MIYGVYEFGYSPLFYLVFRNKIKQITFTKGYSFTQPDNVKVYTFERIWLMPNLVLEIVSTNRNGELLQSRWLHTRPNYLRVEVIVPSLDQPWIGEKV